MLTLLAGQPECLWDDALPIEVKELPADLAALDVMMLADHEVRFRPERATGQHGRRGSSCHEAAATP